MDDIFSDFNSIDWRTWEPLYAISSFGKFWIENERIISEAAGIEEILDGPKWKPNTNDDEEMAQYFEEIRVARNLHDQIMIPNFRYAMIVMLFSLFERELRRLSKNLAQERNDSAPVFESRSFLKQALNYCRDSHGLDLRQTKFYNHVVMLQKVRDCIVHCFGEVDFSREKDSLIEFGSRSSGISIYSHDQIEIEASFIESSITSIWNFFLEAFVLRNWKVKEEWLTSRWTQQK